MHFFDHHWRKGKRWYRAHFLQTDKIQGEKTPAYLSCQRCHERMFRVIPRAKLIFLLRNPVDRAYSAWNMSNQVADRIPGYRPLPFEDAIEQHPRLLNDGEYIRHIESLLRFYPRNQLYFGISERFRKDLAGQLEAVFQFLAVEPFAADLTNHHQRTYSQAMDSDTRDRLNERFAEHNRRLRAFLDDPINEWPP